MYPEFDWSTLPVDGTVVDVGGGIGTVSMALAKMQPNLKLVVQDRAAVVVDGPKRWSETHGDVLASERITFQRIVYSLNFCLTQRLK